MKEVFWSKQALEVVRGFSVEVRQEIGALFRLLQQGERLGMPQARPMSQLATSAFELRIKDRNGIYRVIYVLVDKNRIFVPHAFIKKTQKTPRHELEVAQKRLRRLVEEYK